MTAENPPDAPSVLSTLPVELLTSILAYLPAHDLLTTLQTSKLLNQVASNEQLWLRICSYEALPESTNTLRQNLPIINSYKQLYTNVISPFYGLLGLYQRDFPTAAQPMIRIGTLKSRPDMIIGAEILGENALHVFDAEVNLSVDERHTLDRLEARLIHSIHFTIELTSHDDTAIMYKLNCCKCNKEPDLVAIDRQQLLWILGFEIGDFDAVTQSKFRSESVHGLWPDTDVSVHDNHLSEYYNSNSKTEKLPLYPMRHSIKHKNQRQFVLLQCLYNDCFSYPYTMFRNYVSGRNAEQLSRSSYIPIYSKMHVPAPEPKGIIFESDAYAGLAVKPKQGVYAGTYGSHGIEFVLIHYVLRAVPMLCAANLEVIHSLCLEARKITGDENVPRSKLTWYCELEAPTGALGPLVGGQTFQIGSLPEFNGVKECYPGFGLIAQEGHRNPQQIPCNVIIQSEERIGVSWPMLGKISAFRRVQLQ
ncbi:hypothetical protein SeLEV6574_g03039 [Synchytrium endobioticum]|nr:hypothetical protein SeLEV6574_g03039 [Synchytrium endobioticum]